MERGGRDNIQEGAERGQVKREGFDVNVYGVCLIAK